jgi:hypothetical protein
MMANASAKGWSAKLTRTITLKDGTTLATLGDARAFILKEPKHIQERGSWQHAAELMILAAERGGSIEAATTQIEDALFLEARYVRP